MKKTDKGTRVKKPSAQTLRRMLKETREQKQHVRGWARRFRRTVWAAWIRLLVWAAEATLKKWLAVFGILFLFFAGLFIIQKMEGTPRFGLSHQFAIESEEFVPSMSGATGAPPVAGNKIDILINGEQFYPAILQAIEAAERSVTIEAYIFWDDPIGRKVADALAARARAGVACKVLVDAVGSRKMDELPERLRAAGCQVGWYHPVSWFAFNRVSNRTHREITVVDGRIGFTGGAGFAEHWMGNAQNEKQWRDTMVRIEGPAVIQLQTGFAQRWLETTGEMVSGPAFFPTTPEAGQLAIHTVLSEPETNSATARILYYLSIISARRSILIANPYFVPDDEAIDILLAARARGVEVKIIVPGEHNDHGILARRNSTRLYGKLLEAGVEIYEYRHTMLHEKFMVCDGIWTTVGTINFDPLSFTWNDENNICVYDRDFAARFDEIFRKDLESSDRVGLDQWRNRGLHIKAIELVVSLFKRFV